jgi:hypothetical protein
VLTIGGIPTRSFHWATSPNQLALLIGALCLLAASQACPRVLFELAQLAIIGGLANKLDAATNAAVAPIVDRFLPDNEQLGFQLVAHHVAAAAGGGELLAEFVQQGPVIIYNGDDVALRTAPPRQLPKQHNRLTVADQ